MSWLREQVAYLVLAVAMVTCDTLGHLPAVTIMFKGDLLRCCPRCGQAE